VLELHCTVLVQLGGILGEVQGVKDTAGLHVRACVCVCVCVWFSKRRGKESF
jgi:hypothetical protein